MKADKIDAFGLDIELECYCGKKIKIKYDESSGKKNTTCKYCQYNHLDLIFTWRKQAELNTSDFLNSFFK